jgi:hypothetical protein
MNTDTPETDVWETFCDVSYYHMWRLRRETERGWNDGFHINTRAEAEGLCEILNKLERDLAAVTEQRDRLAEAGKILAEEYEDRRSQWGGEYLWQKYEDAQRVDAAIAVFTAAVEGGQQ